MADGDEQRDTEPTEAEVQHLRAANEQLAGEARLMAESLWAVAHCDADGDAVRIAMRPLLTTGTGMQVLSENGTP